MPNKQPVARFKFNSISTGDTRYETLLYSDGSTSCNCRGWTFLRKGLSKRECRHTNDVEMFSGQIIRGERRAEFWGGETLVDVAQVFIRDPEEIERFQQGEQIRRQAEEIGRQAIEAEESPLGKVIQRWVQDRGGTPPPNLKETARKTQKGLARISQRAERPSVEDDEDEPPKRRYNL